MAAYGPEDFVYGDFDFEGLSDFSDISEDKIDSVENVITDDEEEDDGREFSFCKGLPTKEMIACEGTNCNVEWFHYACVGLTAATIPDGSWFCESCRPSILLSLKPKDKAPSTSGTGSGHGSVDELDNDASTSKQQATSATTTDDPNKGSKTKKEEKKKTDKKAMERPTAKFTKEDAIGNAASYFTGVLSSMKDHPMFNLGNTTTLQALAVITQLLLCINEAPVQEFCTSAVTALWFILESDDSMQLKEQAYMNIWVKYHRLTGELCAKWEELLWSIKIEQNGKHIYTSFQFYYLACFKI